MSPNLGLAATAARVEEPSPCHQVLKTSTCSVGSGGMGYRDFYWVAVKELNLSHHTIGISQNSRVSLLL